MSRAERERFLADVHIGVLGVTDARDTAAAPLLAPVWYAYEPGGDVVVQTGRESLKGRLIRAAGRFSLCVQDERPPYRYVSVEGPVTAALDPLDEASRTAIAHRYLPEQEAAAYLKATENQLHEDVTFRMRPQRWRSADFASFAAEFS
ncbi:MULTISPECIES: pyridoxamine 5'-phosphate oxidase family protein [Streptomyces]|nr:MULTISPECIES: pyridoxamine 5'-phosphate oxidase family protein [Streptomyces]NNG84489.1 pyridoxamine 5'-phosphate oxidase [Streptomyces cacaoi]QHF98244.1 pyridoxamine 5'-phosphate oxidase [Streptomyces sp. NHF165]